MTNAPQKLKLKSIIITLLILGIIFGSIFGWDAIKNYMIEKATANYQAPPAVISTVVAKSQTWKPYISAVGSLQAINGVEVTPQLPGQVKNIYFRSGQMVKEGQPLIKLDTSTDLQDLKNYLAQYQLAKINYERQKKLYASNNASASELDQAKATMEEDLANVDKTRVTITQKTIRAPFAGKIGIRLINIGQYLEPGDPIVTLQALNPIYVNFTLPEQELALLYPNQPITLTTEALPNTTFKGKITAINSAVDDNTHNITVQATINNTDYKLVPGMFADIKVVLPKEQNVVTLPQTAISFTLYGDSVYVLQPTTEKFNNQPVYTVKQIYITTGKRRGNVIAITKGVKAGQQVVTSGQLKLQDGSKVIVNNSVDTSKLSIPNDQLY